MKNYIAKFILTVLVAWLFVLPGCSSEKNEESTEKTFTIGIMPKLVGVDFFNSVEKGALEAGKELGVKVVYDGPVTNDVTRQVAMIETWIARKFDAICVAPNDPDAIAPVLRKAKQRGIIVIAYDADTAPEVRDYFVNQATYDAIARSLVDIMAEGIGPKGKYLFLTGSLTASNQNIWMDHMEKYRAEKYPEMINLSEIPKASEEDQALALQTTIDILKAYPQMEGLYGMTSVALPGAAEAIRKTNAQDKVFLTGLSTPNAMRPFVKVGIVEEFVLWDPGDLGYLTIQAACAVLQKTVTETATSFTAGRLGEIQISNNEFLLGDPVTFNAENIDNYNF